MANDPIPMKPKKAAAPDGADYDDLWMSTDLGDGIVDVKRSSITVDKPKDFFRTHPDKAYRRRTQIYEHKPEGQIEKQTYIIAPELWGRLEETNEATIVALIYRDGTPRIWAIKMPREGEHDNEAWSSARSAARAAIDKWVKVVWSRRSYLKREAAPGYAPDPDWSKYPAWDELIRLGFGENGIIRDESHPVWRDLIGEGESKKGPDNGDDL